MFLLFSDLHCLAVQKVHYFISDFRLSTDSIKPYETNKPGDIENMFQGLVKLYKHKIFSILET